MVAFITPDLYRERRDDTLEKREEAITAEMRCRVNPEDVREATNLFREASESAPPKRKWSYFSQTKCWFDWILEGVVDYLPNMAEMPVTLAAPISARTSTRPGQGQARSSSHR